MRIPVGSGHSDDCRQVAAAHSL